MCLASPSYHIKCLQRSIRPIRGSDRQPGVHSASPCVVYAAANDAGAFGVFPPGTDAAPLIDSDAPACFFSSVWDASEIIPPVPFAARGRSDRQLRPAGPSEGGRGDFARGLSKKEKRKKEKDQTQKKQPSHFSPTKQNKFGAVSCHGGDASRPPS